MQAFAFIPCYLQMMRLSEIRLLRGAVWFLIIGTMLSKASYFISMPYLAIRLKTALELSPVKIGVTLGIGPFVGILAGFYIGYLSDLCGRKAIFTASILLWSLTFVGFAFASDLWQFALLNTLNGLCNAASYPVLAAFISDLTKPELRKTAFHLRYYATNLGAVFGPLAGAWLLLKNPSWGFLVTALVYLAYGLTCLFFLPGDSRKKAVHEKTGASFKDTLQALVEDRPLLLYTSAFVLMGITYAQIDSTLPQYLHAARAEEGVKLFGLLMTVNGLTVVLCQIPLSRLTSGFSLIGTVKTGTFIYAMGLSLLGLVGFGKIALALAMIVLTCGEILIFSNGNLVIDRIAPEEKKGAYFGASGLWALGPTVGPILGGFLLMRVGGIALFPSIGALALVNIAIYDLGFRAQTRRQTRLVVNPT